MLAYNRMTTLLLGLAVPAIVLASDEMQELKNKVAELQAWKDHVTAELKTLKLSQSTPISTGITGSPRHLNEDAGQVLELSGSSGSAFVSHESSSLSFAIDSEGNKRLTVGPSQTNLKGHFRVDGGWVGIGVANNANPDAANLEVQGTSTAKIVVRGDQTGYVNAALVLVSTHSSNYRGGGTFMYDEGADTEWFAGRPYASSDRFIIARESGVGKHSTATAQNKNAKFSVFNDGTATMSRAQLTEGTLELGDWDTARGGHFAGTALLTSAGSMTAMFRSSHTGSFLLSLVVQGRDSADGSSSMYYSGSWYVNIAYGSSKVNKIGEHTACCGSGPVDCSIHYDNSNSLGQAYTIGVKCASFGAFSMAKAHYSLTGAVSTAAYTID